MAEQPTPANQPAAQQAQPAGQTPAQTPQPQTPASTSTPSPVQAQKKKNKLWLVILIIFFLLLVIVAVFWYIWQYTDIEIPYLLTRSDSGEGAGEEEETEEAETEEVATETFTGDYISGEVPEDWTIVEYINGVNDDLLSSGTTYVGLTGFGIKDETDTELYRVDAAYGIGGVSYCEEYYQFADDSQAYYNEAVQTNQEIGEAAPTIVDLSAEDYVEYEILGVTVRRIGSDLYWDAVDGDNYFQATCYTMEASSLPYSGLSFTANGDSADTYITKLPINTDDDEKLELLDVVLQSLELN